MNDIKSPTAETQQQIHSNDQTTDRQLLETIYLSVEKTRKYIFWMNVVTIAFVVIPILIGVIAALFLIRGFSSYSDMVLGA